MFDSSGFIGYRLDKGFDEHGNEEIWNYGGVEPNADRTLLITDPNAYPMLMDRCNKTKERVFSIFFDADKEVCHQRMILER